MLEEDSETSSGVSRPTTSSTTHPPTKRKPVFRPTGKALDLSPFAFSPLLSSDADTDQGLTGSPSIGANPNQELEPMTPCIILVRNLRLIQTMVITLEEGGGVK